MSAPAPKKSKYPPKSLNGQYDFDLLVIGGGSGGLAASKEAAHAREGVKVGVFDFVKPTPHGTKWGLGGTCVNVGCIPKKIMHYSGLLGHTLKEAYGLGWNLDLEQNKKHNWDVMVHNVDDYIRGLNYNYKKALVDARVEYFNAYAEFIDAHTVLCTDEKGNQKTLTSEKFIIAVGGRPKYPADVENAQLGLTSDDIFWWDKKAPGKTLLVGASYISLECGGFLHELGFDTTVMIRSIVLRGFDVQSSVQVAEYMERQGVRFLSPKVPTKLEKLAGPDGPITVTYKDVSEGELSGQLTTEEFDTVIFATGRDACVTNIGLEKAGVKTDAGKIPVNDHEQTNIPNIYAIGDVIKDRPELTPVAIQAGQLLARRLYQGASKLMDYVNIPTTVFTPLEYGCCGLSEEAAIAKYGLANIKVYASRFGVLEGASVYKEHLPKPRSQVFIGKNLWARQYALKHGQQWDDYDMDSYEEEERHRKHINQPCLAKLVVHKGENERVLGFHYVGPNAGEITQGFGLAVKLGATKAHFDDLVGIHPTAAEEFTTLTNTTTDGEDIMKKGGC